MYNHSTIKRPNMRALALEGLRWGVAAVGVRFMSMSSLLAYLGLCRQKRKPKLRHYRVGPVCEPKPLHPQGGTSTPQPGMSKRASSRSPNPSKPKAEERILK